MTNITGGRSSTSVNGDNAIQWDNKALTANMHHPKTK